MDKYSFGLWYAIFSKKIFKQKQIKNVFLKNITINIFKIALNISIIYYPHQTLILIFKFNQK